MIKSRIFKFVALIFMCLSLAGCNIARKNNPEALTSLDNSKDLVIATSFYPVYISTVNITKDITNVKVINMTKPQTGCLHDYSLTPDDLKILEEAKIFVINGAGIESFMDKVISQQPHLNIVDASKGIQLLIDNNGEVNPHVWVSISNAMIQVKNIAAKLEKLDPKNAQKYRKNTEIYLSALGAEKNKMHNQLDNLKNRNIITFHEAFPYFAKEFNLNVVDIIEREPGSEPSAQEIGETINIVKKHSVKVLFAEPQYPVKAAQTIARETDAKIYILNPVVTGDLGEDAYIKIMDSNLKSLKEALK